jgi:hypothetical protein
MFNGLINIRMLFRGAMLLAPIFIAGLLTEDPSWFRVEIVTISVFIVAERSRLTPLGVLLHTFAIAFGFLVMTVSLGKPEAFVTVCVLLAIACVATTAAGAEMRWTGSFTFIPVLYMACMTADGANGQRLGQLGLHVLPFVLYAAIPVILTSGTTCLFSRLAGKSSDRGWFALRLLTEAPAPEWREGVVAAALAVGVAAALAEWHSFHYTQWLVWSAASVVTGNVATARAKWRDRMLGAIVGVPVGVLFGILLPHAPVLFDALTAVTALTLVAFNRYVVGFGARCALHPIAIIVAGHAVSMGNYRAIDVVVGSVIGIVFVTGIHSFAQSLRGSRKDCALPSKGIE